MKLSTIVIAGFALASTAGAASAAQVFESYNYYSGDYANIFVTNNSASTYSDVTINGVDLGSVAPGASSANYYAGDPCEGGPCFALVTVTVGASTSTGNFYLPDYDFNTTQLVGTISTVPEPAAWALMLVGVGAVGASLRASRRTKLATA
ncbi:MAG: hypothetical protein JWO83_4758 [Caulobacteraceae bacterium]|nr:hypothetical protein [Caulobacteraceae bacterium]